MVASGQLSSSYQIRRTPEKIVLRRVPFYALYRLFSTSKTSNNYEFVTQNISKAESNVFTAILAVLDFGGYSLSMDFPYLEIFLRNGEMYFCDVNANTDTQ